MKNVIQNFLSPVALSGDQVNELMAFLCDETVAQEPKAFVIGSVMMRGVTSEFLAQAAHYLLKQATPLHLDNDNAIDVCGTGGDMGVHKTKTFNVSTAAAFILAADGVPVVKHGNKAVSSRSGSSDVLSALHAPISTDAVMAEKCFRQHGLCFVSAPHFHPVLKNVGAVRKAIGVPTFFNLLGPLLNPALVRRQLIGVYESSMAEKMAAAAESLGKTEVMAIHSEDGLDEISLCAPTHIYHLKGGRIRHLRVSPEDLGMSFVAPEHIRGGDASENAAIIEAVFSGEAGPKADIVCLNAAAAFIVAGKETEMIEGIARARAVLKSGRAMAKLNEMRNLS